MRKIQQNLSSVYFLKEEMGSELGS